MRWSLLESKYRDLIELYSQSNKSVREFCIEQRISSWTFYSWRKRLQRGNLQPSPKASTPVSLFSPVTLAAASTHTTPTDHVEVVLPEGVLFRIPCHASAEIIRATIDCIRGR